MDKVPYFQDGLPGSANPSHAFSLDPLDEGPALPEIFSALVSSTTFSRKSSSHDRTTSIFICPSGKQVPGGITRRAVLKCPRRSLNRSWTPGGAGAPCGTWDPTGLGASPVLTVAVCSCPRPCLKKLLVFAALVWIPAEVSPLQDQGVNSLQGGQGREVLVLTQ